MGEKKERDWTENPPENEEEYQKALLDTTTKANTKLDEISERVTKIEEGAEPEKEGEEAPTSLKSLKEDIVELKGTIERVKVNAPPLFDEQGREIPVTNVSKILGMDNTERKAVYDWWENGPVFDALRKMGKATEADVKRREEYLKKTEARRLQKAETSEAYRYMYDPKFAQMQRKAAVTGSMGLEQTGYGLEWAPATIGSKIIALATYDSVILKEAQEYPMSVHKTSWPTADYSGYACKWPASELDSSQEDADVIATSTFAMQARWGYVLALLGRQFIVNCRQYGIAAVDSVLTFMKHAAAVKFDTTAWTGATATEVCDGLEVDASINDTEATAGIDTFAEITFAELINFKYGVTQRYRKGAKWYGSGSFVSAVRQMEDTNGNLINPMLHMPNPLGIDGDPVVEVDVANTTEEDAGVACVYGNLYDTFAYGFLEDMIFESTSEKYWVEGGVLFRLEFWGDMGASLPTAIWRYLFNTA